MDISITFKPNDADESEGLNDGGIENFRNSPYYSTARECGQNSADAHDGTDNPVRVTYSLIDVPSTEIPGIDEFSQRLNDCFEEVKAEGDHSKEKEFFEAAIKLVQKEDIPVLRIDDYNTYGLQGPCVPGTAFHTLVKSKGRSQKFDTDSGGSFGIGKAAAFTTSSLQTVFYSTIYRSEGNSHALVQGKSHLISHRHDGSEYLATGYWGEEGFSPLKTQTNCPNWLSRDEVGASIIVLGFIESNNWEYRMMASLVMNFFRAISESKIEFSVSNRGQESVIDASTLSHYFELAEVKEAAEAIGRKAEFDFSREMYHAFKDTNLTEKEISIPDLGEFVLTVSLEEDASKKVALLRNGMYITDTFKNFGDSFKRFDRCVNFCAMLEPTNKTASSTIKDLENPQHDELSPEYIRDPMRKKLVAVAMRKLGKEVRETIKSLAEIPISNEEEITELKDFIFFEDPSGQKNKGKDADRNPESYKITALRPKVQKKVTSRKKGKKGGGNRSGGGTGNGEGTGIGSGRGSGEGGVGRRGKSKKVELREPRNVLNGSSKKRLVHFTPTVSANHKISIFAAGLRDSEILEIKKANTGTIDKGSVVLKLKKNTRMTVALEFATSYDGPVELEAEALPASGDDV